MTVLSPGPAKGQPPTPPAAASTRRTPNCKALRRALVLVGNFKSGIATGKVVRGGRTEEKPT